VKNIIQYLLDETHCHSARWRFPYEKTTISGKHLAKSVKEYAVVLQSRGIGKGDRIGFTLENGFDFVCLLYATWYLNAVAVPLRPRTGRYYDYVKYIRDCDNVCGFKLIICENEESTNELSKWAVENEKTKLPLSEITREVLDGDHDMNPASVEISAQDIAVIQFSSGSTGNPKGVIVTHAMMMAQLKNIEDNHSKSRSGSKVESSASWLPVNHDMGLFIGVLSPIYSACDNVLAPPAYYMKNPRRWFGLLSEYGVDFTFSTNSVLASSLNSLRGLRTQSDIELSKLHIYIAAEKVSPIIVRKTWDCLSQFGCPQSHIHVGYGMAENALGATYTSGGIQLTWFVLDSDDNLSLCEPDDPYGFELTSIGIANDEHTITIRNETNEILSDLQLGEICIESPCVSPAYYNDPLTTELKLKDGVLRTADLGFHYNGEFYFYSRADDLIIVGGRNIVPDDIETTVESLDFIRYGGSVLLGIEDQITGAMQLHLLLESNGKLPANRIADRCVEVRKYILDKHDLLIKTISVCSKGSIEKTSSGKKRRKVIKQRLSNSEITVLEKEYPNEFQGENQDYEYQEAI